MPDSESDDEDHPDHHEVATEVVEPAQERPPPFFEGRDGGLPTTLQGIAPLLWAPSYAPLFEREMLDSVAACGPGYAVQPSSYRTRLHGERMLLYDAKLLARERDAMAVARHSANMRVWTPSLCARSIVYFNGSTSFMSEEETRQRRLASRPATLELLRAMRDSRPEMEWAAGRHVMLYAADQTYEWVGMQKRGRRQAMERHDVHGMPMQITHEVYINSVKIVCAASSNPPILKPFHRLAECMLHVTGVAGHAWHSLPRCAVNHCSKPRVSVHRGLPQNTHATNPVHGGRLP